MSEINHYAVLHKEAKIYSVFLLLCGYGLIFLS